MTTEVPLRLENQRITLIAHDALDEIERGLCFETPWRAFGLLVSFIPRIVLYLHDHGSIVFQVEMGATRTRAGW
jgi:hypothetical protein